MKLKFFDLAAFIDAYRQIENTQLPFSLAYQLFCIKKEVDECIGFYRDKYNACLEQYAQKEENGTYKMSPDGSSILLKEETLSEARQKFFEIDNYEFPLNSKPIPITAFETLTLSPSSLTGLLPFIEKAE